MRTAKTVLGIIQERGKQGLPLEDIYRQLFNPDLYLRAYSRIYSNAGTLTAGSNGETVDAMSLAKIGKIIEDLRYERYRWTPARRTYIPKANGKKRPLGVQVWSDKLLQEVIRSVLEAYYEPQMSERSQGFRARRGCHTALQSIQTYWVGTVWFIEGDLASYFDTISHTKLLSILQEKLKDNRFLRLLANLLKAGYLENWQFKPTLSGVPQGSGVSPILANVYLDKFDQYVENELIPAYTKGKRRKPNLQYAALEQKIARLRKQGKLSEANKLWVQLQQMPSGLSQDPDYRRLRYCRYADDWLLGFIGSKAEAEEIKARAKSFLQTELNLELNEEKTLITHARTSAARFLGYEVVTLKANDKHDSNQGYRNINGKIGLRVPVEVLRKYCSRYKKGGKAASRANLLREDDFSIISQYQAEYRGIVQYYLLAHNVGWFNKLHWIMKTSLLKTLARKHRTTLLKMSRKYRATLQTSDGALQCLEKVVAREGKPPLIARFGGISLKRVKKAVLSDHEPDFHHLNNKTSEILQRLLADECELCGSKEQVEVHHIRKLADLRKKGRREKRGWIQIMAARKRKTLVVCRGCHETIHAGKLKATFKA